MLTAYLVCLVVGGVFVGLSVFAGMKDGDGVDKDVGGKDFDKDLGGKDFGGKDFDKSFEKDFDLEGGHAAPPPPMDDGGAPVHAEGGHDGVPTHEAPTSDAALAGHPGEKRQVPRRRFHYKRGAWLPFTS
ncbi:MAG TPA: hypothetical protein PK095_22015, partial [Myxococcota bacterium]|nr:hypothetical protein [Myxococcota bacterium]